MPTMRQYLFFIITIPRYLTTRFEINLKGGGYVSVYPGSTILRLPPFCAAGLGSSLELRVFIPSPPDDYLGVLLATVITPGVICKCGLQIAAQFAVAVGLGVGLASLGQQLTRSSAQDFRQRVFLKIPMGFKATMLFSFMAYPSLA